MRASWSCRSRESLRVRTQTNCPALWRPLPSLWRVICHKATASTSQLTAFPLIQLQHMQYCLPSLSLPLPQSRELDQFIVSSGKHSHCLRGTCLATPVSCVCGTCSLACCAAQSTHCCQLLSLCAAPACSAPGLLGAFQPWDVALGERGGGGGGGLYLQLETRQRVQTNEAKSLG
jgi:hypothetical protein